MINRTRLIFGIMIILLVGSCGKKKVNLTEIVQEGDIIFQNLDKSPEQNIWTGLGYEYNQVGIIIMHDKQYQVYTVDDKVKYIPLQEFVKRGRNGQYIIKRMIFSTGMIDRSYSHEIAVAAKRYRNLDYDYQLEIDNKRIYGPELVWKIYWEAFLTQLEPIQIMTDLDLSTPGVQKYIDKHFNGSVPYRREIITIEQILHSEFLEVIAQK